MTSTYQITRYTYVVARRWEIIHGVDPSKQTMEYLAGADGDGNPEWTTLVEHATQSQSYAEQQEAVDLMCPKDEHWVVVKIERTMTINPVDVGPMTVGDVLTELGVDQ